MITGSILDKHDAKDELTTALLIAAFAFALRLIVALLAYARTDIVSILWPRGVEALGIANSLLSGAGFSSPFALPTGPTAFLAPGYPVILAGIERLFGRATGASAWAILTMQCLFSAITCVAIYAFARRLLNQKIAYRAAWIWALFPYAVILPTNIIWESSVSALLLVSGLLLFSKAREASSSLTWASVGCYWAIACLVNASLLLLLPVLLVLDSLRNRTCWRNSTFCAVTFVVCLLPWSIRNYTTFHRLFPLRDNLGLELWIGNHQGATTRFTPEIHPAFSSMELQHYRTVGEISYMAEKRHLALQFIKQRPLLFLKNSAQRFLTYWFVNWHALWYFIPLITLLAFAGLALMLVRSFPSASIFWIPVAVYPLPYYITHADLRYQHPLQPLLVILCAYGWTEYKTMRAALPISRDPVEVCA
jgi:4-amino-4-deoxy-L-arabinose transferase-like glycosyltransferase